MLYYETITAETRNLLEEIQYSKLLDHARLVGGTALALQYGHRISIDLDFFGSITAHFDELMELLASVGSVIPLKNSGSIKISSCNNIKVDFVNFNYPWLAPPVYDETIILAGDKDIAAIKIAAVTGRGSKKDFYDIYFLLQRFTLPEMMNFYQQKYKDGSVYLALKSLIYFEDAEHQKPPILIKNVEWEKVKETVINAHKEYIKTL